MIQVVKASGQLEPLSLEKIRSSLTRAGADGVIIDKILLSLKPRLYDKIPTAEVYRMVYELLSRYQKERLVHYGLKPAIMALGPSGYPFEKFIAKLFNQMGYATQTQVTIQGQCVWHEVDVAAEKEGVKYLLECKFHQRAGTKTEVKDALYIQARFEDIRTRYPREFAGIYLVTNTRLTSEAIKYGTCKNMRLLAWQYPPESSLESLINQYRIHPLTCLSFLKPEEKQLLFNRGLVLCRQLQQSTDKDLAALGLSGTTITNIRSVLN